MRAQPSITDVATIYLRDAGLLLARGLAAWSLVIFHAWGEAVAGYRHFFGPKEPWPLSDSVTAAGLPAGLVLTTAVTVAICCVAMAFAAGLLTRVAALVLLVIAAVGAAVTSEDWLQELAAAYAAIAFVFLFCGAGNLSLDALYTLRRQRRKRPGPKYQ